MALTPRDENGQGCSISRGANLLTQNPSGILNSYSQRSLLIHSSTVLDQDFPAWDPDVGTHRGFEAVLLVVVGHQG